MRLSREQTLFLVVLVIAGFWGYLALSGGPDPKHLQVQPESRDPYRVPDLEFVALTEGIPAMPTPPPGALRSGILEEPTDVSRPGPLDLEKPRLLDLPIVMPPPAPRPGWNRLASLRRILADVEADAEAGEETAGGEEDVGGGDLDEGDLGDAPGILVKKDIPPEEWPYLYDTLTLTTAAKVYGEIQAPVTPARPFGKYSVLDDDEPFLFAVKRAKDNRVIGRSEPRRDHVVRIEFAKTVENFVGLRFRKVAPGEPGRYDDLMKLGRETMENSWRNEDEVQEALAKAADIFRLALEARPDDVGAILLLSECLRRRGEWDENLALLEDVTKRVVDSGVRLALGETYDLLDLPSLAEAVYREASAADVSHSGLKRRLADLLFRMGGVAEAGEIYANLIRFQAAPEDRVAAHLGAGAVALREGRFDEAMNSVSEADRAAEAPTAASKTLESAIWIMQKDFTAAAESARAAMELDPLSVDAVRNLGLALALDGKLDEAKAHFEKARDADPFQFGVANMGLGLVAHLSGRYGESVERYEQASAAMPGDPWLHYILGVSYRRDGQLDQARDRLLRALEIASEFDDVLRQLGLVHQSREEWDRSAEYLGRAVEVAPRNPTEGEARDDLVRLLYVRAAAVIRDEARPKRERLLDAKELYERMLKLRKDDVRARNGLGYVLYMLDPEQSDKARAEFDRVTKLTQGQSDDPDGEYGRTRLAEIIDHDSKVIWRDSFDASEVGTRWNTHPQGWVITRTENGRLVLEVKKQGDEAVHFFQWLPQSSFGKLEEVSFSFRVDPREDVSVGLIVAKWRKGKTVSLGEVAVGRTFKNELAIRTVKPRMSDEDKAWKPIEGQTWPADQPVRVTIKRGKDIRRGLFNVFVNDVPVATDVNVNQLANRSDLIIVGITARGATYGGSWKIEVDEMSMVLKR